MVGQDNKVEVKRIRTTRGPAGQTVVTEGLEVGQLVIIEGSQRARPGAPVAPRPPPRHPPARFSPTPRRLAMISAVCRSAAFAVVIAIVMTIAGIVSMMQIPVA